MARSGNDHAHLQPSTSGRAVSSPQSGLTLRGQFMADSREQLQKSTKWWQTVILVSPNVRLPGVILPTFVNPPLSAPPAVRGNLVRDIPGNPSYSWLY